jgi:hypothetical protein
MTKLEVLQLVKDLTQQQADDVTIDGYFDQLLDDLGRTNADLMTEMESIPLVADQYEYTLPDRAICEHAIFFADRELRYTTVQQLEARSSSWRDHVGKPWAYTKDEQTARTFRLYPIPAASSSTSTSFNDIPLGMYLPSDALVIVYSSRDNTNIPSWLVLPIAYQIQAWEFARPSNHQSESLAALAQELSNLLFSMLGVQRATTTTAGRAT